MTMNSHQKKKNIWVWVNTYRYIFSGMNIHLPAILGFTRYQGFDPSPYDWPCPQDIPISSHLLRTPNFAGRREGAVFGDFVTRQNATASAALGNAMVHRQLQDRDIGKNAENKGQFVLLLSLGIFNV